MRIIACYLSPSLHIVEYEVALEEICNFIKTLAGASVLLARNLHARAKLWRANDNTSKGNRLWEAMEALDFRLANIENTPTCIRYREHS